MLPLWRDQLRIVLSPDKVLLMLLGKGLRRKIILEAAIPVISAPEQPSWKNSLAALSEKINEFKNQSADVTLILSNHFVRYQILPWNKQINGTEEELAYARIGFERNYGEITKQWDVRVSDEGYGKSRLASAIDRDLSEKILTCFSGTKLRLVSIRPYLVTVFNQNRNHIKDKDYLLCIQEAGKLCLASIQNGQWQDVQSLRTNAVLNREELASLIERQCLIAGVSGTNQIHISSQEDFDFVLPKTLDDIASDRGKKYAIDYGKKLVDHRTGKGLLAFALLWAIYFGYVHSQLNTIKMRLETPRVQTAGTSGSMRIMQANAQFNNAKETVRRLTLPWDNLFESIEVSAQEKVALLNIQPDVQKGSVLIVAEARNYDDMLGYTKRLSKTALKDVHILNHQIQRQEPGRPIRFTVTAVWGRSK